MPVLVISKARTVLQTLRGLSPNVFWHSFLQITEVELATKAETFSFSWKKKYNHEERTVAKSFVDFVEWMISNMQKTLKNRTLKFA